MNTHALIDQLFACTQRSEALSLAQEVSDQLDSLAKSRDFLLVNVLLDKIAEHLMYKPNREAVFACSLQFPFSPSVLGVLLQNGSEDQEIFEAVISNLVGNRTWRFDPSTMEQVIKDLAWCDLHESVITILDAIVKEGDVKGAGLDLIAIATEFSHERKDDVMQKWVARNERKLLDLDCEGGITVNSLPGEGISWFEKGVREFGLKMATRNLSNGTGSDLINLEGIQGSALNLDGNPTGYPDEWAYYLFLTPYPIGRYGNDEKTFSHNNLVRTLKTISQVKQIASVRPERVYEIARLDVRHGASKDPAKMLPELLKDYREAGFPLSKPWVAEVLNEIAASNVHNMEKFADTLRIAKTHRVTIDFAPFEAEFKISLRASARKLTFNAGMALLAGFKDKLPIPPRFFGTWFKHCSGKWDQKQRSNFTQAIPMEVLEASDHLRDQRMGADLGL